MTENARQLRDEVARLTRALVVARTRVKLAESTCTHRWSEPVADTRDHADPGKRPKRQKLVTTWSEA